MIDREIDRLIPIERQVEIVRRIGRPERPPFLVVVSAIRGACLAAGPIGRVGWPDGRIAAHVLQMRLAHERGAIAGETQPLDEGGRSERQRNAVMAHAVNRGHAPGHQRRAVRHANRAGDVERIRYKARSGDPVDMRRPDHRIAVAAEMIESKLIGDDEQKIRAGALAHPCITFRTGAFRRASAAPGCHIPWPRLRPRAATGFRRRRARGSAHT